MKLKYKTHLWIWVVYRRQVQHLKISDLQQGTCKPPSSPFPSSPPPTPHQGTCRPSSSPADMPLPPADPIRRSVAKSKQADATTMPTMSSRVCIASCHLRLVAEISRAEQSADVFAMDDRGRRNEGISRGRGRRGRSRGRGGFESPSPSTPLRPPGGACAGWGRRWGRSRWGRSRRRRRAATGRGASIWWRSWAHDLLCGGGSKCKRRRETVHLCVTVRWTCKMDHVYGCSVGTCFCMKNIVLTHFGVLVMLLESILGVTCQTQISGNHD
jgi:hypothetical protein